MKKILIPIILLSCAGAFAQDPPNAPAAVGQAAPSAGPPNIAVYVAGGVSDDEKSALGTRIKLGRQFGVKFICIVDITPAYESFQVSARIVNVETAEVVHIGEAFCPHKTVPYITWVSEQVVRKMFGGKLLPEPHDPSRIRISAGAGAFMPSDFGGGRVRADDDRTRFYPEGRVGRKVHGIEILI